MSMSKTFIGGAVC